MGKFDHVATIESLSDEAAGCLAELEESADRAAVLIGTAFLDDALTALLRARLVDRGSAVQKLMGGRMPINSFAHRIRLAYCIGLLGSRMYRDLFTVRRIGRKFGHSHRCPSFDEESVREDCHKLRAAEVVPEHIEMTNRERFVIAVVVLTDRLLSRSRGTEHLPLGKDFKAPKPPQSGSRAETQDDM